MANAEEHGSALSTELLFEKFQSYFDKKFDKLANSTITDETAVKELKIKLEAKELTKPGNSAQLLFCGQLEIILDKIKVAFLQKGDTDKVVEAIHEAEDLLADRKQKIKIADSSRAGWITIQQLEKGGKRDQSSEDQKKVQIAEDAALKELEGRKKQKTSDRRQQDGVVFKNFGDRSLFRGKTLNSPFCLWLFQRASESWPLSKVVIKIIQKLNHFVV